jgi:S1-C subfamily serine protease
VSSTVANRYTFDSNTVDVLAIAGSAASQEGSSGGAVVNAAGELIGLITTSEISGDVSTRQMRVITPSYIMRSYQENTGKDFVSYFGNTSLTTLINVYAPTAQSLGQFLAHAIGLQ